MTPADLLAVVIERSRRNARVEIVSLGDCLGDVDPARLKVLVATLIKSGDVVDYPVGAICLSARTAAIEGLRLTGDSSRWIDRNEVEPLDRRKPNRNEITETDYMLAAGIAEEDETDDDRGEWSPIKSAPDHRSGRKVDRPFAEELSLYLKGRDDGGSKLLPSYKLATAPRPRVFLQGPTWPVSGQDRGSLAPDPLHGPTAETKVESKAKRKYKRRTSSIEAAVCRVCKNSPNPDEYCDACDRWGLDYLFIGVTIPTPANPEDIEAAEAAEREAIAARAKAKETAACV